MSVYFDKSKGRWRYSYNRVINKQQVRATKLLPAGWTRDEADAFDRQKSGDLYAYAAGIKTERLTLAGAVRLYVQHRCPELANGRRAVQSLQILLDQIGARWLDEADIVATEYQTAQKGRLAPATIRNRLAYLRAAVRYARKKHQYGRGQPDHAVGMSMPAVNNGRTTYATLSELDKLWAEFADEGSRALFRIAFYCGLRWRAELLTRAPEHIRRERDDVWLDIGTTKNGDAYTVFVHPAARDDLPFIPFLRSDTWYHERWTEATAAIGRPDLRPHDLRHSLASEILSRPTGTLDHVRAALHHKSLQAAQRYAHLYPSAQKAILSAIGAGELRPGTVHAAEVYALAPRRSGAG